MMRLFGMVSPHDVAGKRRCARWRHTVLRGLLEGVGEADQLRLAECRPGKGRAKGRRQRAEARWNGRWVGEEAGRHDHAREPRARRRVGAEVSWEESGIELLARGAYRNGDDIGALRRNHSGVEH